MEQCRHPYVFTLDSLPPIHTCTECGKTLPLTEQDKRDYQDYTGHAYVEPPVVVSDRTQPQE